jgi:hypothetical protein
VVALGGGEKKNSITSNPLPPKSCRLGGNVEKNVVDPRQAADDNT